MPPEARGLAKGAAIGAAVSVGRWLHRKEATVLNYHRFHLRHAAQFRWQCEYLRQRYRVISLGELTRRLREGAALPANAVVLTIDDGHRDFYTCAFPTLREYGFAATMYLPTAFLDRTAGHEWLWFDRFNYAFLHSPLSRVEVPPLAPGDPPFTLALESASARAAASSRVATAAQWYSSADRDAYCDRVATALDVRIPKTPPEEFAPLSWDEVRLMAESGIEFGGHTVTHPILETIRSADELAFEIAHCKARVEEELQRPTAHFAYPSGRANEISAAAKAAVREAGFQTAVTTLSGQVGPGADPLWLRRIGVDPDTEPLWFQRCAAAMVRAA
jgi:peptidoglycan/xylan/chitin deacetylase (PgdA/CDA1 family)